MDRRKFLTSLAVLPIAGLAAKAELLAPVASLPTPYLYRQLGWEDMKKFAEEHPVALGSINFHLPISMHSSIFPKDRLEPKAAYVLGYGNVEACWDAEGKNGEEALPYVDVVTGWAIRDEFDFSWKTYFWYPEKGAWIRKGHPSLAPNFPESPSPMTYGRPPSRYHTDTLKPADFFYHMQHTPNEPS